MAKKKNSKRGVRNTSKIIKSSNPKEKHWMTRAGWSFVNMLLSVTFLYGIYVSWSKDGKQGLSIIVAVLLVIFFIRLYLKFKRK